MPFDLQFRVTHIGWYYLLWKDPIRNLDVHTNNNTTQVIDVYDLVDMLRDLDGHGRKNLWC